MSMFHHVGLLTHVVLHPPQQYGYLDHYHFSLQEYFREDLRMAGDSDSAEKKLIGLSCPNTHSVPIDIPVNKNLGSAKESFSVDSGMGTSSFEAGSGPASPSRSVGTQTPTRKGVFDTLYLLQTPATSFQKEKEDEVNNPILDHVLRAVDKEKPRSASLPAVMPIAGIDFESYREVGRELRNIADEYDIFAASRRTAVRRGRSQSMVECKLLF